MGPSGGTGVMGPTETEGPTSGLTMLHGEDNLGTDFVEDRWLSAT